MRHFGQGGGGMAAHARRGEGEQRNGEILQLLGIALCRSCDAAEGGDRCGQEIVSLAAAIAVFKCPKLRILHEHTPLDYARRCQTMAKMSHEALAIR